MFPSVGPVDGEVHAREVDELRAEVSALARRLTLSEGNVLSDRAEVAWLSAQFQELRREFSQLKRESLPPFKLASFGWSSPRKAPPRFLTVARLALS